MEKQDKEETEIKETEKESIDKAKDEKSKSEKIESINKLLLLMRAISTMNIIKNDNIPVKILDNIYIGSIGAANNKEELTKLGITHIVTAAGGIKCSFPNDFKYHKLDNLLDSPTADIKQFFDETNKFIKEAISNLGSVLVHCHAGISRSSTIILAYMIGELGYKLDEALKLCQEKRSKINPNKGFIKQLEEYQEEIIQKKNTN